MKTIRRGYFYTLSLVSLEVVLWAVINLVRAIFDTSRVSGGTDQLAGALSAIVVGVIVFGIHWRTVQKDAATIPEERFSGVRAVFFYATLAALLVPGVQSLMSLIYRLLTSLFNIEINTYGFGSYQTINDSLIIIVISLIAAYYFYRLLQGIWAVPPSGEAFPLIRRIFRYLWKLYALGIAYAGVQQILTFVLSFNKTVIGGDKALALGIAFTIVGLPIWVYVWRMIQTSLSEADEQKSMIRQIALYLLTFLGVAISLGSSSGILFEIFSTLFRSSTTFSSLLDRIADPLAIGLPAGLVWWYFGNTVKQDRLAYPHETQRSGLRRLYYYILAFIGVSATFIAIELLVLVLIDLLFQQSDFVAQDQFPSVLSAFLIGVPLWLRTWGPMNTEASTEDEAGDHARRSVNRKGYLYLTLFACVLGVMGLAGTILYLLISALLGDVQSELGYTLTQTFASLVVVIVFGLYHLRQLRTDSQLAESTLANQHAEFSVVVLEPKGGGFAEDITAAIQTEVKDMPVAVHPIGETFDESLANASAVILPSDAAANPPEALRLWLESFGGVRLVVPVPTENWVWVGVDDEKLHQLAKQAAKALGALAEGQLVEGRGRSVWVYVLAGMFGIPFLCILFSLIAEYAF